jgi:hypothetical protein
MVAPLSEPGVPSRGDRADGEDGLILGLYAGEPREYMEGRELF